MVLQSSTLPCNYVQFRLNYDDLWGEVCSREWDCACCGKRPLPDRAAASWDMCATAGKFNYETHWLDGSTMKLAILADNAMMRAFDEPLDYELGVYFKRTDALSDLIRPLGGAS